MECNREEAIRAKEIAEKKMEGKDFSGALKIASKANKLYPELDNIEQMILVCEVHCSSENKICGNENDWYSILKVDPTSNGEIVKKQYRKFALLLHPDKNKFPGATDAFKLIGEAQKVLLDHEKRSLYDQKRLGIGKSHSRAKYSSVFTPQQQQQQQPTFWTVCSFCSVKYQYYVEMKGKLLWCQQCKTQFVASEINTPGQKQNDKNTPQCHVKINPQTVPVDLSAKGRNESKVSAESKKEEITRKSTRSRQRDSSENFNPSKKSRADVSSKESLFIEYPCPDLNDFDKTRRVECFKAGQIWAFYDVLDAMPRFYGVINKIFLPGFKLQISWLEPDPDDKDELKWAIEGLPVSCGKFRLGSSETIKHLPMLSHMVCCEEEKTKKESFYNIYPKKGETWAIFKDWDINWHSHTEIKTKFEYEFVEVLSDCCKSSGGVDVAPLVKVKGYRSLFTRKDEKSRVWISLKEVFRFSHKVSSFKMKGTEGEGIPNGSFELDPGSLPVSSMINGQVKGIS
ncbi:unnamed protein product [Cuscuta epithymum]|uniref:J domain-containing protein n=1 Tax=Cuscuta epithymum TaxID=186058 RepID=A0AAV0CUQ2_9ASTE|nr:unnamed protein product [Cuscuta epithymum]